MAALVEWGTKPAQRKRETLCPYAPAAALRWRGGWAGGRVFFDRDDLRKSFLSMRTKKARSPVRTVALAARVVVYFAVLRRVGLSDATDRAF